MYLLLAVFYPDFLVQKDDPKFREDEADLLRGDGLL
jgi:hypothetical protein